MYSIMDPDRNEQLNVGGMWKKGSSDAQSFGFDHKTLMFQFFGPIIAKQDLDLV